MNFSAATRLYSASCGIWTASSAASAGCEWRTLSMIGLAR